MRSKANALALGSLFFLSIFQLAGCLGISSQDPTKIFVDGQWPSILKKLNGQLLELRNRDAIIERVRQDQQRSDLLRVAVIDNGVDYANPALEKAIAFDVANGEITGAGYDVLGKDNTPSPQLLNPSLFAFGAKDVIDGKILDAPANPLDLLLVSNQDFEKTLREKFANHPELASSFFAKGMNGSINIVGAFKFLKDLEAREKDPKAKTPKATDPSNEFIPYQPTKTPEVPSQGPVRDQVAAQKHLGEWLHIAKLPWVLEPETGLPLNIPLFDLENVQEFGKILKETFNEVDQRQNFTQKYQTFLKFLKAWNGKSADHDKALTQLAAALAFKQYGPGINDPLYELNIRLRKQVVAEIVRKNPNQNWSDFSFNGENVGAVLDTILESYQKDLEQWQEKPKLSLSEKVSIKTEIEALPQLKALKDWYIKNRGGEQTALTAEKNHSKRSSAFRKLLYRARHPFIDSASAETSHGTHVSGIIQNQDPRIRIYPVRVLTQGIKLPEAEKEKITAEFTKRFTEWLQDPLVFKAVSQLIKPLADMIGSQNLKSTDPQVLVAELLTLMNATISEEIGKEPTNYLFIGEVIEAIKKVGGQKIKIANISLGTEFKAPVVDPNEGNPEKILKNGYKFLEFEFFKYQIGSAITRFAPNTLFVVANGNSGKWVDGRSQSALPVDLSSPFLAKFEDAKSKLIAPNNQIKNVIGVGSLAVDGQLSSFTNLIISKKTPFIMAEGESVLSPVRSLDPSGIDALTKSHLAKVNKIGKTSLTLDFNEADSDDTNRKLDELSAVMTKQNVLQALVKAINTQMVVEFSDHHALMSGTSMASPTAAGLIARDLIEEAIEKGLNPEKIYEHPEFTPEKVIQRTMARAKVMEGDLYLPLKALTDHKRPERGASVKKMLKAIEQLKEGDASGFTTPLRARSCRQALRKKVS